MSAAAPNPQKLLALAVLGIGVYWFMSKRAVAGTGNVGLPASQYRPTSAATALGAVTGLVNTILGKASTATVPLLGTVDGRSATQWDVTPAGPSGPTYNNPSAYVSSAVDGAAFNPPGNVSPFDVVNSGYASNDPAAWWN